MRAVIRDTQIITLTYVQLTVWMSLFYSFPALVLFWQADFGWTTAQIMGAFSLSIAVYALGAPLYGRLIDRGLAQITFPLGALGGAVLLVSLTSTEPLPRFYITWAALGSWMGLTLYGPCFALVTRARAGDARAPSGR
jgi:MFS family permease